LRQWRCAADGDDIDRRGEKTLDQALESVPGIQVYTHTKGHQRLRLRGFDQDYVVVMIDGIPVNDVYSTDMDLTSVPVSSVSKIVVNIGTISTAGPLTK